MAQSSHAPRVPIPEAVIAAKIIVLEERFVTPGWRSPALPLLAVANPHNCGCSKPLLNYNLSFSGAIMAASTETLADPERLFNALNAFQQMTAMKAAIELHNFYGHCGGEEHFLHWCATRRVSTPMAA
jgi:hypothetical protein